MVLEDPFTNPVATLQPTLQYGSCVHTSVFLELKASGPGVKDAPAPQDFSLALPGHPGCTPTQAGTGASDSLAPGASSYPELPSPSRCPFCAHVAVLNLLPLQRAHVANTTLKTFGISFFLIPSSPSMEGLKIPLRQVSLKSEHASIEGSGQETPPSLLPL